MTVFILKSQVLRCRLVDIVQCGNNSSYYAGIQNILNVVEISQSPKSHLFFVDAVNIIKICSKIFVKL